MTENQSQTAAEATAPATGAHTTDGTPHGYTSITPFVAVADPQGAIDFYREVFGAREVSVFRFGETVVHAEVALADGRLQLGAPQPDSHLVAPAEGDDRSFSLAIYLPDVDAAVERATRRGATLREPAASWVSGDRFASILDPFGVRWTLMTRVADLSDEESARRVSDWAANQG